MNTNLFNQRGSITLWPPALRVREEEVQEINKQKREDKLAVADLVKKSNRILLSISSHAFPFDLFPDTINIEEGRITIITRTFFLSSRVHSVDIKDVSNIFVNIAPFFAQLVIISKTFEENEVRIKNLRKDEAVFARRIIEGLRLFASKQIETSNYTVRELLAKLQELSTTEIVT
jgi:hypothetical protein